ncbi:agmatinase family protein [Membranihabitans marinus]|uniref:agmatinase family protein n=1 Tax=Membranihabitans marinus TaxID=1227546 RepID=UPI001F3586FF|nr:agmatinase family protein [Membranihabitans marinus]
MSTLTDYSPNGPGMKNNNFIGLPFTKSNADLIFLPVPWDVTTSYSDGTSLGPQNLLNASYQLDLMNLQYPNAWKKGLFFDKISKDIFQRSQKWRKKASQYIQQLESGQEINAEMNDLVDQINQESQYLNEWVYTKSKKYLDQDKQVILIGGDHSTPLGYIKALGEKHGDFGILQIDAHCDLRKAYENFTYSHASIMYNVLEENPQVKKLVQVGIRDFCPEEYSYIQNNAERIHSYYAENISKAMFHGESWNSICDYIVSKLPPKVYISFDIDGLDPSLCPHTGTPVPGGLQYYQATYLIDKLQEQGRTIIGADLCEVAGDPHEYDGSVGSRLAYHMACNMLGE